MSGRLQQPEKQMKPVGFDMFFSALNPEMTVCPTPYKGQV
jgi:hypothetical protein